MKAHQYYTDRAHRLAHKAVKSQPLFSPVIQYHAIPVGMSGVVWNSLKHTSEASNVLDLLHYSLTVDIAHDQS